MGQRELFNKWHWGNWTATCKRMRFKNKFEKTKLKNIGSRTLVSLFWAFGLIQGAMPRWG